MFMCTFLSVSFLKLLFTAAYKSTDFEVHRNWLAITHNLPPKQWYYNDHSIWTLDYPPLFGWFEYVLSHIAAFFDDKMLHLENLNYSSPETILFQRLSVISTDAVYAWGVYRCWDAMPTSHKSFIIPLLMLTNVGLFIVDHIHFQYNGMLFGILLISISHMLKDQFLSSAFWFSILLNMKHIFIYVGPAYFIYLLRNCCFSETQNSKLTTQTFSVKKFTELGTIVISVFAISFGVFYDHLDQVMSRLFPFKRGLCHAYWAPNFWAFYNTVDKLLEKIGKQLGYNTNQSNQTMTGGLVHDIEHSVLPTVRPMCTLALTIIAIIPLMIRLWRLPQKQLYFIRCIVLCGLTSFMFGWHVHEKAILIPIIPLSLLITSNRFDAKIFLILSISGHYSLFPLLFEDNLILIKLLLLVTFTVLCFYTMCDVFPASLKRYQFPLLNKTETLYLIGFVPLYIYTDIIHRYLGFLAKFEFLPLWITSLYSFVGVLYSYISYYYRYFIHNDV